MRIAAELRLCLADALSFWRNAVPGWRDTVRLERATISHKYGFMVPQEKPVKTTVEVPDELYRRAKAEAAMRGRKLKDLIEEGLRLVLDTPQPRSHRPTLGKLMKNSRGIVDSGVPDLASNPRHLADFGRDARRHR